MKIFDKLEMRIINMSLWGYISRHFVMNLLCWGKKTERHGWYCIKTLTWDELAEKVWEELYDGK